MTIFFYGADTYRSRQKLNETIEDYKKAHQQGLSLKYFNVENSNFEDLSNEIQQISIFNEKKLIVLTNVFSNQDFKEKFFKNHLQFMNSKDIIVIYEENTPPKSQFFEFLKKEKNSQEFNPLGAEGLRNWVKKEFSNYRVEIEPAAIDRLINYVGDDLWQMANEIKKLANFGQDKKIEKEDIEMLVKPAIETDIFQTIDALAVKNKKQAISLIHHHLGKGDSPLYLLSMINFQFRNLIIVKDLIEKNKPYYTIAKTTKLHPFVVRKTYQQAQKFTLSELKKIYQKIFEVDLNIKTGKIDSETALDILITEI